MEKQIYTIEELQSVSDDKLKAVYALNMCMVSVSQIIDYNDAYVLEQEYDAILNNLNLEVMPKDEALLKTITELLNTITFFRIQDIKKAQLDKEYQQRIKNAIWSAVPSPSTFGVIPVNAASIALSLAAQIGTSYMSYRREKNHALSDKEKAEVELQITAIEQLNALRRELFTTAWRLADRYDYPDCLRLTEKQIKQYNEILMDHDEYRKYARLEAVQRNFFGYPPFWYYFAHTALYIATSSNDEKVKEEYTTKAKSHFKDYQRINKFNIFREDQLTASANLEHIDLLLFEPQPDYNSISNYIDETVSKAGNAKDVLQLCAVAYLRAGNTDAASELLKILVNEEYNTVTNAKILSRMYVSKYMETKDDKIRATIYSDYKILERRAEPLYLFPMPKSLGEKQEDLDSEFFNTQKNLLKKMYRNSLAAYAKKKNRVFNEVIPAPYSITKNREQYFDHTDKAKELRIRDAYRVLSGPCSSVYVEQLRDRGIKYGFIDVLNETIIGLEELNRFKNLDKHDEFVLIIEKKLRNSKKGLVTAQEKMNSGIFTFDDYQNLVERYSFQNYTKDFFRVLRDELMEVIETLTNIKEIEQWEFDLTRFCNSQRLPNPEAYIRTYRAKESNTAICGGAFFNYDLIGESNYNSELLSQTMKKYLQEHLRNIVPENCPNISVYLSDDDNFKKYWERRLRVSNEPVYTLRKKAVAIIKDKTKKENDLVLCVDGVRLVTNKKVGYVVGYHNISFNNKKSYFEFGLIDTYIYTIKNIKVDDLRNIFENLNDIVKNSHSIS